MPGGLDQVVFPTFAPPERMDWVDYTARNQQADATAFAAEAAARRRTTTTTTTAPGEPSRRSIRFPSNGLLASVGSSVNAIDGSFEPYHAHVRASHGASLEAAAAQAAHDTLSALFSSQASIFDAALKADLVGIPPGRARQGTEVGHDVAQQILTWRSTDGSGATVPYTPGSDPGDWQPTPPANLPALAPQWPYVTPFAMTSGAQFRPAPPPALDSAEYAAAFNQVKDLGRVDSLTRTDEQTQIARFWNDGLGTAFAPGYWNKIAQTVAACAIPRPEISAAK
jgi:hypothetical protein